MCVGLKRKAARMFFIEKPRMQITKVQSSSTRHKPQASVAERGRGGEGEGMGGFDSGE